MMDKMCEYLKGDEVKKFVDSMETFIFDCDGRWNSYEKFRHSQDISEWYDLHFT